MIREFSEFRELRVLPSTRKAQGSDLNPKPDTLKLNPKPQTPNRTANTADPKLPEP